MHIVTSTGREHGPLAWTVVREWAALSLIPYDTRVRLVGDTVSKRLSDFAELFDLPKSLSDPSSTLSYYKSAGRYKAPAVPAQHEYARKLGCPFTTKSLDRHLLGHVIGTLTQQFPGRRDLALEARIELEWEA